MKTIFIPLFDQVLVKVAEEPERTKGGIYIPDNSRKKLDEGIVVSIGDNVSKVKKGDKILFGKYIGVWVNIEGVEGNLLIHETDILGIVRRVNE